MTDTTPITLRPVVRWFAEQMELGLRRNDHMAMMVSDHFREGGPSRNQGETL